MPDKFRITIFGAEPRVNYNRIMLSPLLAGEKCFDDIIINDHDWYDDNAIDAGRGRSGGRDRPRGEDRHRARRAGSNAMTSC